MLILIDYLCHCVNQPLLAFIDTVIRQLQWIDPWKENFDLHHFADSTI